MSKDNSGRDDSRFRQVDSFHNYANVDHARTYRFTRSEEAMAVDTDLVDEQQAQLQRDGYIILHEMVSQQQLD
ncbi:MAG: phytanoyl-CoA dioxygenase family protein, partial [Pseudomonadota bacterium]